MPVERFVSNTGTISIIKDTKTVTGVGTLFGARDREGALIFALPLGGGSPPGFIAQVPIFVGVVAAVEPRGVYNHLSLPLVNTYRGSTLTNVAYVLIDGPAIANSATQAAIMARFIQFLEDNAGLVFNTIDDPDYSLVPNNSLVVQPATQSPPVAGRLYQIRNGTLSEIFDTAFPKAGGTLEGPIELAGIASLTSGTTVNLGAASSNAVTITGTSAISSFGSSSAGVLRFVKFSSSLILVHSAIGIILPTGANITTAANDTAIFECQGGSVWLCLSYKRQSGKPLTPPALTDITVQGSPSAANSMFYWNSDVVATLFSVSANGRAVLGGVLGAKLFKELTADDTGGQNVNTAQPWFPTGGTVSVLAGRYHFRGIFKSTRTAGANSHTTANLFGGTATIGQIDYTGLAKTGDTNALAGFSGFFATDANAFVLKAASTATTEHVQWLVEGWVNFTAGGTFIPQFIYSAAPGGAPTINRGTFFEMEPSSAATQGW